jgi:hypothetical protein
MKKAIDKEPERMIENKVWIPRKLKDLPVNSKLLTTTLTNWKAQVIDVKGAFLKMIQ